MSTKLPENFDDSGVSVEARDRLTRAFEHDLRTLETAELLAKYPEIDEEFVRHVDEFIELYRPALGALAKR